MKKTKPQQFCNACIDAFSDFCDPKAPRRKGQAPLENDEESRRFHEPPH